MATSGIGVTEGMAVGTSSIMVGSGALVLGTELSGSTVWVSTAAGSRPGRLQPTKRTNAVKAGSTIQSLKLLINLLVFIFIKFPYQKKRFSNAGEAPL